MSVGGEPVGQVVGDGNGRAAFDGAVDERHLVEVRQRHLVEDLGGDLSVGADGDNELAAAADPFRQRLALRGRGIVVETVDERLAAGGQHDHVRRLVAEPAIRHLGHVVHVGEARGPLLVHQVVVGDVGEGGQQRPFHAGQPGADGQIEHVFGVKRILVAVEADGRFTGDALTGGGQELNLEVVAGGAGADVGDGKVILVGDEGRQARIVVIRGVFAVGGLDANAEAVAGTALGTGLELDVDRRPGAVARPGRLLIRLAAGQADADLFDVRRRLGRARGTGDGEQRTEDNNRGQPTAGRHAAAVLFTGHGFSDEEHAQGFWPQPGQPPPYFA